MYDRMHYLHNLALMSGWLYRPCATELSSKHARQMSNYNGVCCGYKNIW
jgi:hypothetical protein